MAQRGRKSAAELSVIGPSGVETVRRPDPLPELTDEQSEIWRLVVDSMPADWFTPGSYGTLAQLCRHRVRARHIAQLIDNVQAEEEFDVKEYRDLLRTEKENTAVVESCETKLRLTPSTLYDKSKKRKPAAQNPWNV